MDDPERAWPLVQEAILAFGAKVPDLAQARRALVDVLKENAWRCYDPPIGDRCSYGEFAAWVGAHPPRGLGTSVDNLKDIAGHDPELAPLLRNAQKVGHPGPHPEIELDSNPNSGEGSGYTAQRLAEQHPDEYAAVERGEKSLNRAAKDAGIRRPRILVRLDDAESAARTLRKHMPADKLARLIGLLAEDGE